MKKLLEKLAQLSAAKSSSLGVDKLKLPGEVDLHSLFVCWFDTFPNCICLGNGFNVKRVFEHIISQYGDEIKDVIFRDFKRKKITNVTLRLFDDTVINYSSRYFEFNIFYRTTPYEKVTKLAQEISKFKKKTKNTPLISLIYRSENSLDTTEMEIKTPKLSIKDNYNNDLLPIHKTILNRLQKKDDKGLVLLHGKPGTGKTSYLRYLIGQLDKNVIFLPPNMATLITEPGLVELLMDNKNSIFVIEDAENILIDRNQSGSSAVSALLNLTDGLLSDCLNIQIICTFNTDLSKLDKALLRKGRLIAKYEFNELNVAKAQALSDKLGFNSKIDKPMTLTDIYNQNEESFASQATTRKQVGFNVAI
ncbi:MAG TPA: AAA family ATPase [Salinivirgaceae bacterium]|nr:AAA family ATPase [Salinivirgaceae bacterium]